MFSIFRSDPRKKLEKQYADKLQAAVELQRKGDIRGFAKASEEADALLKRIDSLPKREQRVERSPTRKP